YKSRDRFRQHAVELKTKWALTAENEQTSLVERGLELFLQAPGRLWHIRNNGLRHALFREGRRAACRCRPRQLLRSVTAMTCRISSRGIDRRRRKALLRARLLSRRQSRH